MSFMQRQVVHGEWVRVDSCHGTTFIERDNVGDEITTHDVAPYLEHSVDDIDDIEVIVGYGARLSAPGYMDCTDWCVFDSQYEADTHLDLLEGDE